VGQRERESRKVVTEQISQEAAGVLERQPVSAPGFARFQRIVCDLGIGLVAEVARYLTRKPPPSVMAAAFLYLVIVRVFVILVQRATGISLARVLVSAVGSVMPAVVMVGAQWGDEGKGKIADVLAGRVEVMARFNGGNNAGHTVVAGEEKVVLRLVPVGILRPGVRCYVGRGCVVNPTYLLEELDRLRALGVATDRLMVDWHCHLILPYHTALDAAGDAALGPWRVGTTGRGIGPCYGDRASRLGLRIADLYDDARLAERLAVLAARYEPLLNNLGANVRAGDVREMLRAAAPRLRPLVGDVARALRDDLRAGADVLLEGAHGLLLDPDYGTYPFVTSSVVHPAGAASGLGLPPAMLGPVLGVAKAYQTRVGEGPLPTELADDMGEYLRRRGNEYGSTTGRPRRCGWLDLALLKYAVQTAGIKYLALNKLDVLDGVTPIKVAVGYELDGGRYDAVPAPLDLLARARPVYKELAGWEGTVAGARAYGDLPPAAKSYIKFIEESCGAAVAFVSTGPGRDDGFFVRDVFR